MPDRRIQLAACLLAFALVACHHSSGPSAAYERANALFLDALKDKGDDAAMDPRADEALGLARSVAADSIDRAAADALVSRIEQARRDREDLHARLEKAVEVVADPSVPAAPAPPPAAPAAPETGHAPTIGSSADAFHQRYGACVKVEAPFVEKGGKRTGEAFALASADCEQKFPELKDQLVAVLDGKVFNVLPKSAATPAPAADSKGPATAAAQ